MPARSNVSLFLGSALCSISQVFLFSVILHHVNFSDIILGPDVGMECHTTCLSFDCHGAVFISVHFKFSLPSFLKAFVEILIELALIDAVDQFGKN